MLLKLPAKLTLWVVVLSLCSAACADDPPEDPRLPQITRSLDGWWKLAEGGLDDNVPTDFPANVNVPGLVSLATPPFEKVGKPDKKRAAFWYRTEFPAPKKRAFAQIAVGRAKYGLALWLNGKRLRLWDSEDDVGPSAFTRQVFDASAAIRWDKSNVLVARVGADPSAVDPSQPTHQDLEKERWVPGIYGRVQLVALPAVSIRNVKIETDLQTSTASAIVEIRNRSGADVTVNLRYTFLHPSTKIAPPTSFSLTESKQITAPTGTSTATIQHTFNSAPNRWSPELPALGFLQLDLRAVGSNEPLDRRDVRYGFRSVRWRADSDPKKRGFFLNGKRTPLVGSNVTLHRFFEDATLGAFIWDKEWVTAFFEKARSLGMNCIRICVGRAPQVWYEVADEVGMLLADEFQMWTVLSGQHAKWTEDAMVADFDRWMRQSWNHPSIAWWDASNETLSPLPGKVIAKVRGLDPTRQWENGGFNPPQGQHDPIEDHPYLFMHTKPNSLDDLEGNNGQPPQGAIPPLALKTHVAEEHPYILNEYGWLWINRDGTPAHVSKPVLDQLLGKGPHGPEIYREAYAYLVGGLTRMWRAKRGYAAVKHFTFLGYSKAGGATSDNFLDVEKLALEPRWEQQATWAFGKVIPYIDRWQLQVKSAQKGRKDGQIAVPMLVINDDERVEKARLSVMAVKADGSVVAKHGQDLALTDMGQWQGVVELAGVATPVTVYAAMRWQGPDLKNGAPREERWSVDVRKVGYAHVGLPPAPLPEVSAWP